MTSGQDVSECSDTFGLLKSYFVKFIEKKIEKKNVLVLRLPRGSGDLLVYRITS
jgi:hypothetical protein